MGFIPARAGEPWRDVDDRPRLEVHPRACGGAGRTPAGGSPGSGSSPRVRGSPRRSWRRSTSRGFIPARAGEPVGDHDGARVDQVHPRACGGASSVSSVMGSSFGSSPRVRGSPGAALRRGDSLRFIPARAGEPVLWSWTTGIPSVHPRACGGAECPICRPDHNSGSSPRVRGSLVLVRQAELDRRFIPARAGEPRSRTARSRSTPVHPRACGGARTKPSAINRSSGSSPRVRGSQAIITLDRDLPRFIPARAGEPLSARTIERLTRVHPRACGGAEGGPSMTYPAPGSSPRVRGSLVRDKNDATCRRFIPARAGEPPRCSPRWCRTPVHPRACGGAARFAAIFALSSGSSPRVRGSRRTLLSAAHWQRFIPARAGEPAAGTGTTRRISVHPRACGGATLRHEQPSSSPGSSPRVRGSLSAGPVQRRG